MQFIDKDIVIKEIERRINSWTTISEHSPEGQGKDTCISRVTELNDLLAFLYTLKVQDVNLEKELDEWMKYGPHTSYPWCTIPDAIKITAEYFFELGLKVN